MFPLLYESEMKTKLNKNLNKKRNKNKNKEKKKFISVHQQSVSEQYRSHNSSEFLYAALQPRVRSVFKDCIKIKLTGTYNHEYSSYYFYFLFIFSSSVIKCMS